MLDRWYVRHCLNTPKQMSPILACIYAQRARGLAVERSEGNTKFSSALLLGVWACVSELWFITAASEHGRARESKHNKSLPNKEITAPAISKTPFIPGCSAEYVQMLPPL